MTRTCDIPWTPRLVEACLVAAADTLRQLPEVRAWGYVSTWPDIVMEPWQANAQPGGATRLGSPSASEIDGMDVALEWLRWLEPRDRMIVWDRASRRRWKVIAHRYKMDRTTAWRHWAAALVTIAGRLNGCADTMPVQHFSMQHFGVNLVE